MNIIFFLSNILDFFFLDIFCLQLDQLDCVCVRERETVVVDVHLLHDMQKKKAQKDSIQSYHER